MAEDILLGPGLKVDINGQAFATVSGNYQVTRDLVSKTDTESAPGGTRVKASPLRRIQLTLVLQRDPDVPAFGAPINIWHEDGVWLRLWLGGRADPDNLIDIPVFVVGQASGDWNVQGSAAQGLTLQGENDGDFLMPGEV